MQELLGTGGYDRVNHAFAYGKAQWLLILLRKCLIRQLTSMVQINMEGLMEFVDAVGDWYPSDKPANFLLMEDVLSLKENRNAMVKKCRLHVCVTMIRRGDTGRQNVNVSLSRNLLKK